MQAGRLRHVITIEEPVETQDATGAMTTVWQTWADGVRASIEDVSTREQFAAAQVQAEITTRVRIRYRRGVHEKMRIRHVREHSGSPQVIDYYDIQGPPTRDVATGRRELQLLCLRRSAEGFRTNG